MSTGNLWLDIYILLAYVPGWFIVRTLQKTSHESAYPGDELGSGTAFLMWVFSPVMVPFVALVVGFFFITRFIFPPVR